MQFLHRVLLLTAGLHVVAAAWGRKQVPITSNSIATSALSAIESLQTEHKQRMEAHKKIMIPYTNRLDTLVKSLGGQVKLSSEERAADINSIVSELVMGDYDDNDFVSILLKTGGLFETRMKETKGNAMMLAEARKVLGLMGEETESLRVWTEEFKGRVERVKGEFEEGKMRKGRQSRA
jgi:hypothetical protein